MITVGIKGKPGKKMVQRITEFLRKNKFSVIIEEHLPRYEVDDDNPRSYYRAKIPSPKDLKFELVVCCRVGMSLDMEPRSYVGTARAMATLLSKKFKCRVVVYEEQEFVTYEDDCEEDD